MFNLLSIPLLRKATEENRYI